MRKIILITIIFFSICGCSVSSSPTLASTQHLPTSSPAAQVTPTDPPIPQVISASGNKAYEINHRLGRGVNFGDALEAPNEGDWGVTLQASYFTAIKSAGFNAIRVPIGWTFHAQKTAPYTIDSEFFNRVDWVITQAKQNNLLVILDMHNYPEMMLDPKAEKGRFLALWEQIASHY